MLIGSRNVTPHKVPRCQRGTGNRDIRLVKGLVSLVPYRATNLSDRKHTHKRDSFQARSSRAIFPSDPVVALPPNGVSPHTRIGTPTSSRLLTTRDPALLSMMFSRGLLFSFAAESFLPASGIPGTQVLMNQPDQTKALPVSDGRGSTLPVISFAWSWGSRSVDRYTCRIE